MKRCVTLAFALLLSLALLLPCLALSEETVTIPEMDIGTFDIPDNEAMAFLRRMGVGWNLGNTLDAHDGNPCPDIVKSETMWGQPVTSPELMQMMQQAKQMNQAPSLMTQSQQMTRQWGN